ncbi:AAA family ATPase [Polyangium spumosum]|uniref:AAA family ATPase n=1 Tax=Polyangium spumosum TaxID=889282 RepID=A0A6N7Q234_9BACT|nr:ATP-binding protein [Polyangium spumosum]MRG95011.1 AAA family ATPase [Polyangium spumosum]
MKLVVEKVGRIERAEIEVRPLTVFIGENGTGKTWTAMGLFALLKNSYGRGRNEKRSTGDVERLLVDRANEIVEQVEKTPGESLFEVRRSELLRMLPEQVEVRLDRIDGEKLVGATLDERAQLRLALTQQALVRYPVDLLLRLKLSPRQLSATLLEGDAEPLVSTNFSSPDLREAVQKQLAILLFAWIRRLRVLPVERDFLSQKFVQLLLHGQSMRLSVGQQAFCELLGFAQARSASSSREDPELVRLTGQVLGGRFRFEYPSASLVFTPQEANAPSTIPIAGCASMQKSLAGLQFFLETAERGDFLIIDEPELSAHPEAQVKLVELFALMIRQGIQLVLITHSPYIIDRLSTLIELARLDEAKRARVADALALKNAGAYVKPDEVAVWQFNKDGSVTSVYDEESGSINWSTFTRVTNQESVTVNRILDEADDGAGESA